MIESARTGAQFRAGRAARLLAATHVWEWWAEQGLPGISGTSSCGAVATHHEDAIAEALAARSSLLSVDIDVLATGLHRLRTGTPGGRPDTRPHPARRAPDPPAHHPGRMT